jgi:hypothetical protein
MGMPEPYVDSLRKCVAACRDQFLFYAQNHRAKGADDKAATNEAFAQRCAAVLAEGDAKYAPNHTDLMVSPESLDALMDANPPPVPLEVRRNEDGSLDEITASNATLHLEQIGGNIWWMRIEVEERAVVVHLTTPETIITGRCEDEQVKT